MYDRMYHVSVNVSADVKPTVFYMRSVVYGVFFLAVACVKYECAMVSCVQNSLETFLFGKSGGP